MSNRFSPRKFLVLGFAAVLLISLLISSSKLFENVDADEIVVIQAPWTGTLNWYTTPGVKWQGFGKATTYKKRSIYVFDKMERTPDIKDDDGRIIKPGQWINGIIVRFYEGGHGMLYGSIQYDMPLAKEYLTAIHTKYGSQEAVQKSVIETITNKAVYLSGQLMSSKESYSERRTDLVFFVEDQIQRGIYKTKQKETRIKDPITNQEKTTTVVEIVIGKDGQPERQEEALLSELGIKAFNFAIAGLPYDEIVETQIKQQQQIAMDVQTAIADAKKAEQGFLTATKQGEANAAVEKWKQMAINAKIVAEAEQRFDVAKWDAQAAEQYKIAQLLRAEGDSEYKRRVMEADGALQPKLDAWMKINEAYAQAIKEYQGQWVPSVIMGSQTNAQRAGSGAQELIDLLTARTAKELGIDFQISGLNKTAKND